jgi:hypothetical protein
MLLILLLCREEEELLTRPDICGKAVYSSVLQEGGPGLWQSVFPVSSAEHDFLSAEVWSSIGVVAAGEWCVLCPTRSNAPYLSFASNLKKQVSRRTSTCVRAREGLTKTVQGAQLCESDAVEPQN